MRTVAKQGRFVGCKSMRRTPAVRVVHAPCGESAGPELGVAAQQANSHADMRASSSSSPEWLCLAETRVPLRCSLSRNHRSINRSRRLVVPDCLLCVPAGLVHRLNVERIFGLRARHRALDSDSNPIMGTYVFKWPHPAGEVYVTGTFDDWAKTEKLERHGDAFQKTVTLPSAKQKILYKFVVDGHWTTDHMAASEGRWARQSQQYPPANGYRAPRAYARRIPRHSGIRASQSRNRAHSRTTRSTATSSTTRLRMTARCCHQHACAELVINNPRPFEPASGLEVDHPGVELAHGHFDPPLLLGAVPLEHRREAKVIDDSNVPAVVTEEPACGSRLARSIGIDHCRREKSDMESELKSKVPEEPATSENYTGSVSDMGKVAIAGGAAAVAGAAAYAAGVPSAIQNMISSMNTSGTTSHETATSSTLPATVQGPPSAKATTARKHRPTLRQFSRRRKWRRS
ncbi:hypothetical protein MRB53_037428 [Persea americana]|nr:hypothetical protein MRB53_037428 [Persea americana]